MCVRVCVHACMCVHAQMCTLVHDLGNTNNVCTKLNLFMIIIGLALVLYLQLTHMYNVSKTNSCAHFYVAGK